MRLAINQPYFFPYLGYFSLIKHTDRFILLDKIQFIKQGWIHRNRVLSNVGGFCYIRVPLQKHCQKDQIADIRIDNRKDWRAEILQTLTYYTHHAPYYRETRATVERALDIETDDLTRLNQHVLQVVCQYLGMAADLPVFSELDIELPKLDAPDDVPLYICQAVGNVREYWNLEGGASFYDRSKFERAGIDIQFKKMNLMEYPQIRGDFEPALSIIDVMMFNDLEKIHRMLDDFILI